MIIRHVNKQGQAETVKDERVIESMANDISRFYGVEQAHIVRAWQRGKTIKTDRGEYTLLSR